MILTGRAIESAYNKGDIIITEYDKKRLNTNSYNLRLHDTLMVYDDEVLDMKKSHGVSYIKIPKTGLKLEPGKLYLGRTVERTGTSRFVQVLEGRSSIGRLGMFIHITANTGNIGFEGYWTLEISVVQPLIIYPDVEVCQVSFHEFMGSTAVYGSNSDDKYQDNVGIQPSKLWKEFYNS